MKVAISLPDKVFEAAEAFAERAGKSRSQLYAEALADYLEIHQGNHVTEQLNSVYAVNESKLEAGWIAAQAAVLDDEAW
jgi:metal-responsive CopG/Arc/MetJ family transcriptional regulator